MNFDDLIKSIEREISQHTKTLQQLQARKEGFLKLKQDYPTAEYDAGSICSNEIWDKVSCMRLVHGKGRNWNDICAKFLLHERDSPEGLKLYTNPLFNTIATIKYNYGSPRKYEITIFDYKALIPDSCPNKKKFIRRIKLHLVKKITQGKLTIAANSFYKDEFENLLLIK
jgi:hypothetical protein